MNINQEQSPERGNLPLRSRSGDHEPGEDCGRYGCPICHNTTDD